MSLRNTLCAHQMLDLQMEQSIAHFHPLKVAEYANQGMHPPTLHTAEMGPIYRDYPNRMAISGNPYNSFQNYHAVANLGLVTTPPSNYYPPLMFSQDNGSSNQLNEFSRHNQFNDNIREFGKWKNDIYEPATSGSSSSSILSINSGLQLDCTNFEQSEYQERENIQIVDGSNSCMTNRSSVESEYVMHPYYMMQAAHMGPPLNAHPTSTAWMTQFGTENDISNRACSSWNHSHPIVNLNCSGAYEFGNMGVQAFPIASSSSNTPLIFNPTSLPNFHQAQNYGCYVQMQANALQNPFHIMHHTNGYPINAEQIYQPRLIHHAVPNFINGGMRILSSEDATLMDISGFYGIENVIDQHQDMRLDIDEMSYEELLALEERIGYVKTGLTEEYIIKNLRKNMCRSKSTCQPSDSSRFYQETEACIICQVEYEEDEIIGTLDCGHSYHGECIKQWLLVKNLCPICKKTALGTDNIQR